MTKDALTQLARTIESEIARSPRESDCHNAVDKAFITGYVSALAYASQIVWAAIQEEESSYELGEETGRRRADPTSRDEGVECMSNEIWQDKIKSTTIDPGLIKSTTIDPGLIQSKTFTPEQVRVLMTDPSASQVKKRVVHPFDVDELIARYPDETSQAGKDVRLLAGRLEAVSNYTAQILCPLCAHSVFECDCFGRTL